MQLDDSIIPKALRCDFGNPSMLKKIVLLCCIALLATSCTTTKVIDTWQEEQQAEKYKSIFVFGMLKTSVYRSLLERQLVDFLKDAGVDAHTTFDLFPNIDSIDKVAATAVIKEKGGDSVMVIRVMDYEKERHYQAGKSVLTLGPSVYHSYWYSVQKTQLLSGSEMNKEISMLESMIFDVGKEKRVWSAVTKTTESSIPKSIYSFRKVIGKKLKSSGLF